MKLVLKMSPTGVNLLTTQTAVSKMIQKQSLLIIEVMRKGKTLIMLGKMKIQIRIRVKTVMTHPKR